MTHVKHNSGNNEWYTPSVYLQSARLVMGGIDCDPASSQIAQQTVKAGVYYTKEDDGLIKDWQGRVWMNPPYAGKLIQEFCKRLSDKYSSGEVTEFITLTNNATETKWFDSLARVSASICFVKGRVRFIAPDGTPSGAPLQGQCFIYAGKNSAKFSAEFVKYGRVFHV